MTPRVRSTGGLGVRGGRDVGETPRCERDISVVVQDSDTFRVFQRRRGGCFASLRFASSSRSSSVCAAIVCGDSSIESVRVVM